MRKYSIDYRLEEEAGAGVSITPVAFLVVQNDTVKLLSVDHDNSIDKILDYVPDVIERLKSIGNNKDSKE